MADKHDIRPERVARFANYFKTYMGLSTMVTAALPIPLTVLNIIPMFEAHRRIFSAYTSLFCFLLLAYVFYMRHPLARLLFSNRRLSHLLPLIGVLGAIIFFALYHFLLENDIMSIKSGYQFANNGSPTTAQIFADWPIDRIPNGILLTGVYIAAFVFAEFAFVIMATREYMQDVLNIGELELYALRH
jgi:hypothetical protein